MSSRRNETNPWGSTGFASTRSRPPLRTSPASRPIPGRSTASITPVSALNTPSSTTTAQSRRVGEEHREREQGSDDPEHGAEHARHEVGAVLELLGEVEAPEGCEN